MNPKTLILSVFMIILAVSVQAQIPQQLNYQGIARNLSGSPISYQKITARISIIDSAAGGQVSYAETRKVTTNYVGLFNIVIGSSGATNVLGRMQDVNWPTGRKFIKLEIDPNGGGNYALAGMSELQSVPYALSASTSGSAGGDLTGTYPSPSIANGVVTNTKLANASVDVSKLDPAVVNTLNGKLDITDTAAMLAPYAAGLNGSAASKLNIADTAAMLSPYASALNDKLNIADTAAMLSPYASALNDKLNVADTAAMLNAYAGKTDVNTSLATKLNIADTAAMLSPYASALNDKLNIADTAAMLSPYASALNDKLNIADTAAMLNAYAGKNNVNTSLATKLNIADTAAMLNAYAGKNNVNTSLATKLNIADTTAMLTPYANSLSNKLKISDTTAMLSPYASSLINKLNISDTAAMLSGYAPKIGSISASGSTNYLPKFTGTSTFGNSSIFDNGTKLGIFTSAPSSLFQIGGETSTELNLKFDFTSNNDAALKIGYRQYQWRMKTNTNSGTLDPLNFSYYNGTTDVTRLSITNSGIQIPDNLTVTGNISGASGTLADLNVNNGQLKVDKVNNRIGFFTGNPNSLFQVGGEANTDLNLKYDFVSNTSSALKLGYRQYQWRFKTSTESGVLQPLVFSYYNGTTDVDLLKINTTGGIVADSYVKVGGTSSQYLMADGSVSTAAGIGGSGAAGQMSYWTSSSAQSGAANFTWDNTNKILKVGPGVTHVNVDYMHDPALSTSPVMSVIGDVTTSTEQTVFRLKRVHNQGTSYAAVADFVMKGGTGNYTQLDLRLNNPDNVNYVSAMTFTNAGRVGINNPSPGSTLDVNGAANVSGLITANGFKKAGGTSSQFLKADGSVDANSYLVREVADEFTATASQLTFTLTHAPSANSKVKMYINGLRISNSAYSVAGTTLTYNPASNGSYSLTASDRVQFDYYY